MLRASYAHVQATVGVGTVLIWDFGVAYTRGGGVKVVFQGTAGANRGTMFFLSADGKAQILMANCKNWKAEAARASVCWVCGRNRAGCIANFWKTPLMDGGKSSS